MERLQVITELDNFAAFDEWWYFLRMVMILHDRVLFQPCATRLCLLFCLQETTCLKRDDLHLVALIDDRKCSSYPCLRGWYSKTIFSFDDWWYFVPPMMPLIRLPCSATCPGQNSSCSSLALLFWARGDLIRASLIGAQSLCCVERLYFLFDCFLFRN